MSLKEFIFSKIFLKHLGLAVIIVVGLVMVLLLWLNIYTRHGQSRTVPDFYGKSLEETSKLARKGRVKIQVVDSVYTSLVPKGSVAEQNPKPGFKVKKWRTVTVIINAFRPEMVAMPDLVDLPLRQAIAVLEGAGLTAGTKRYKPDQSINMVLEQYYNGRKVAPNDSIQKGSPIDLVLGKGLSNQRTQVPNLVGLLLTPALSRISETALNLGTYVYDNTILTKEDSANAFVYKQNPEFREDATLQFGSSIYLWLTTDSLKLPVDTTLIAVPDTIPVTVTPPANIQ